MADEKPARKTLAPTPEAQRRLAEHGFGIKFPTPAPATDESAEPTTEPTEEPTNDEA